MSGRTRGLTSRSPGGAQSACGRHKDSAFARHISGVAWNTGESNHSQRHSSRPLTPQGFSVRATYQRRRLGHRRKQPLAAALVPHADATRIQCLRDISAASLGTLAEATTCSGTRPARGRHKDSAFARRISGVARDIGGSNHSQRHSSRPLNPPDPHPSVFSLSGWPTSGYQPKGRPQFEPYSRHSCWLTRSIRRLLMKLPSLSWM